MLSLDSFLLHTSRKQISDNCKSHCQLFLIFILLKVFPFKNGSPVAEMY